jgi:hypothetical protein
MEPSLKRDIRLSHHKPPLDCDRSGQIQEKALPRPIPADYEANTRTALLDPLQIADHGINFVQPTYLEVAKTRTGHNTGPQGLQNRVTLARLNRTSHDRLSRK